jgi:hypothetical protein
LEGEDATDLPSAFCLSRAANRHFREKTARRRQAESGDE